MAFAEAVRAGTVIDLAGTVVDADMVRTFCVAQATQVDPRGIRLTGARITGVLDLSSVEVPFPLRFSDCVFDEAPRLHGASVKELAMTGATLPGLLANGLRVQGDLDLSRSVITGQHPTSASTSRQAAIWLCESEIGGRLLCVDTTIDAGGERAIHADRMRVGGTVRLLHNFHAQGELRLVGLQVAGSFDLTGAVVRSAGIALDLSDTSINGNLIIMPSPAGRRPEFHGRVDMSSMRIDAQLLIRDAILAQPQAREESHYSRARFYGNAFTAQRLFVGAELSIEGDSSITGTIDLASAELGGFSIEPGGTVSACGQTAINFTNAEIRSDISIGAGVPVRGMLQLSGARIRGRLTLNDVILSDPCGGSSLKADGTSIDGNVDLRGLHATGGQLKFWRATIGGGLEADGAVIDNPHGASIRLHQCTIGASVRLVNGFTSTGTVLLSRSQIGGRLDLADGTFHCPTPTGLNPDGAAIQAVSARVNSGMNLAWAHISPAIDLTDTLTTVLQDDPATWPERIFISGFTYDRLDLPRSSTAGRARDIWDWRRRLVWLRRQAEYDAGPYEQAARVFRQHGYTYGAEQILIAQRVEARRAEGIRRAPSRSTLDALYGLTVGYGYRPGRVLWFILLLLTLVSVSLSLPGVQATMRASDEGEVFSTTHLVSSDDSDPPEFSGPCGDGRVRCFNPVLYAVDTVIPLMSLDQRATWYPDHTQPYGWPVEWWLNLSTVIGWVLSSIALLSFARLARAT
jgi:hypothetical protein